MRDEFNTNEKENNEISFHRELEFGSLPAEYNSPKEETYVPIEFHESKEIDTPTEPLHVTIRRQNRRKHSVAGRSAAVAAAAVGIVAVTQFFPIDLSETKLSQGPIVTEAPDSIPAPSTGEDSTGKPPVIVIPDLPPTEEKGEHADASFPDISENRMPDAPVAPYGSLGEYYLVISENRSSVAVLAHGSAYNGDLPTTYPGVSYDAATNTLTLENATIPTLVANWMGNGLTVYLIGENRIDYLEVWGFYTGGCITFTGPGSVTINASQSHEYGILLEGECSKAALLIDSTVQKFEAYGSTAALLVCDSSLEKGLYYLAPLSLEDGTRAETPGNYEGNTEGFKDYTVVDEAGQPVTHLLLTK